MSKREDESLQCSGLWKVCGWDIEVIEKVDGNWEARRKSSLLCKKTRNARRMPSSSDDLTLAIITSETNGLNTTMRKTTIKQLLHKNTYSPQNKNQATNMITHLCTTRTHLRISPSPLPLATGQRHKYTDQRRVTRDLRIFC